MSAIFDQQPLFVGGTDGYAKYRIPSLLVAANGDILAFCEGRRDGPSDSGQIELVCKRSSDHGATWSAQRVIVTEPEMTCGNPCPVLVRETGEIVMALTKNRADGPESMIRQGQAPRTAWTMRSADHGRSWSAPEEITAQVKCSSWQWYATGPGHGLQLASGRLVIPCDHSVMKVADKARGGSHLIYSDDQGRTWHIGAILSLPGNESCVLQCDDGSLYLNCRTNATIGVRTWGRSYDDGLSFLEEGLHEELIEPRRYNGGCQASLLQVPAPTGQGTWMLFCNPATDEAVRRRLAIRVSTDQGRTWDGGIVVHEGPAGYSDLALTGDGSLLCLYEQGDDYYHDRIALARAPVTALTGRRA